MLRPYIRGTVIGAGLCLLLPLSQAQAQTRSPVETPSFLETVDIEAFHNFDYGKEEVHFSRTKHPLERHTKNDANVIPLPLPRLRHMTFVIRLELEVRTYNKVSSASQKALEDTLLFYKDLLEHAHRVSNRYVRVCAHHMGLKYAKLSHVTITPAGPVPRTVAEYQQWATQSDPAPCYRDQLFSSKDAEQLTRLHQLQRLTEMDTWSQRDFLEQKAINEEILNLKNEFDGTPWIPNMKMSEIKVLAPQKLWIKNSEIMPHIKHGTPLPTIKVVTPYQQE
jgi:hypothetical protein